MSKEVENNSGIVTSVGRLGDNHEASNDRSYWNEPTLFTRSQHLIDSWVQFREKSVQLGRRRAMMRTLVTEEVLTQVSLPIEAVIPQGDTFLIYLGQNVHQQVAPLHSADLPTQQQIELSSRYSLDQTVSHQDSEALIELWTQFGWTSEGVNAFIKAGTTPIVVIRYQEMVVGAMIAESLQFGELLLVELTEMAVQDSHKGHRLASVLIQELTLRAVDHFGSNSLIYGEYNMTTRADRAAARAGNVSATSNGVTGILPDHVAIQTGEERIASLGPWDTRWLHNFLVMYHPTRSQQR